MSKQLTIKQQRFCDNYIKTGNVTQSYIDAGYKATSNKIAYSNAKKLLEKYYICKYIEERNKELESEKIADIQEVKEYWTRLMHNDPEGEKSGLKASELLAKTYGAFLDRVETTGELEINVNIEDE